MRPTYTTVHCKWPLPFFFFLLFWDRPTKTWVPTRRLAAKRGAWQFYYECGYEELTQLKTWVPTRRLAAKRGAWPPNETVCRGVGVYVCVGVCVCTHVRGRMCVCPGVCVCRCV